MRPLLLLLLLALCIPGCAAGVFSDDERSRIKTYWNAPGRYKVGPPLSAAGSGRWQAHLTPDASRWFLAYSRSVGKAEAPPTVDAAGTAPSVADWERWVKLKLAYDQWQAEQTAAASNGGAAPTRPEPPVPPVMPEGLLAAAGNPPPFSEAVAPMQYTITFDDGDRYTYQDHVTVRPRYAYYRFPQGVVAYGQPLRNVPGAELDKIFVMAGMNASEVRIAKAVSRLEGGFDSVNTYDTGYLSVGFIQFASFENGTGSLAAVLAREKTSQPKAFETDFRRFGMDVTPTNTLVVVDPATGAELAGAPAVMKVIDDKRLTAVFQRAGLHSQEFRAAQVEVARDRYWPADDKVAVTINGQSLVGKVSDVIKSEAGLAALFDRKVNRGSIAPFDEILTDVMNSHRITRLADATRWEREIVSRLKYRTDFLADKTLGQPQS